MRPTSAFALFFSVSAGWRTGLVAAALVNITLDDTDPSILFQPNSSWHANSDACSACLKPNSSMAYNETWHEGLHIIPTSDDDDCPKTNGCDPGNPFHVTKLDGGDTGFVDKSVTVQLNFTGSAVYLYCIQPLHASPTNSTPTFMNLTFTLDGHVTDSYIHNGSRSTFGFSPHINVFSRNGLSETAHLLQVNVGPDSVFLFDYMQYSQTVQDAMISITSTTTAAESSVSTVHYETDAVKRRQTGTFAGAVGGSVGVLTIFAFGLAFNLYRRRYLAARRDHRERQQNELLNGNTERSPMYGPAPFVPRYFPGTIPTAPPPYIHNVTLSEITPYETLSQHPSALPYTDLPPPSPPPPSPPPPPLGEGLGVSPPPFVAVTMPLVAVPPNTLPQPTFEPPSLAPPLPPDTSTRDDRP